jgi:hypothetical protein
MAELLQHDAELADILGEGTIGKCADRRSMCQT